MSANLKSVPPMTNREETARFISLIERDPASLFAFQTFDDADDKDPALIATPYGTLDEHYPKLEKLNARRAGIFICINETRDKQRTADNIKRIRACFCDFDKPEDDPLAKLAKAPLKPSIIVESSPGKYHAYWLVEDMPVDEFEAMQKRITEYFGSDPKLNMGAQCVMRLPGFVHNKGAPFMTRIHEVNCS